MSSQLTPGETAVNTADAYMYVKHVDGAVKRIGTTSDNVKVTGVGDIPGGSLQDALAAIDARESTHLTQYQGDSRYALEITGYLTTAAAALTYAPRNSPTFTGAPLVPTAAPGTNSGQAASTAFAVTAIANAISALPAATDISGLAPLASPTFSGVPTAPTATPGTNTQQIASTAFVTAAVTAAAGSAVMAVAAVGASGVATTPTNFQGSTVILTASVNLSLDFPDSGWSGASAIVRILRGATSIKSRVISWPSASAGSGHIETHDFSVFAIDSPGAGDVSYSVTVAVAGTGVTETSDIQICAIKST